MRTTLMLAAMSALLASAATSQPPRITTPSERASYDDLDLGTDVGRSQLEHRIRSAAGRLCFVGDVNAADRDAVQHAQRVCFNAAVHDGLAQMDRLTRARTQIDVAAASRP